MHFLLPLKTALIGFVVLLMAAGEAPSSSRFFYVQVQNETGEVLDFEVSGNKYFEGTKGKYSLSPGQSRNILMAFNNRSDVSWWLGYGTFMIEPKKLGEAGHFGLGFQRQGGIYIAQNPVGTTIEGDWRGEVIEGFSRRIGRSDRRVTLSPSKPGRFSSGPFHDQVDHYYTLSVQKANANCVLVKEAKMIVEFTNEQQEYTESNDIEFSRRRAWRKITEAWATAKVSGSGIGVSAEVSGGVKENNETSGDAQNKTKRGTMVIKKLKAGQMRVVIVKVQILKRPDGKYIVEPAGYPSEIVIPLTSQDQLNGLYTTSDAIGLLDHIEASNDKKFGLTLLKYVPQR
jgi:hypothetical protein